MLTPQDLAVKSLGPCQHASPLNLASASHRQASYFATDSPAFGWMSLFTPKRGQ